MSVRTRGPVLYLLLLASACSSGVAADETDGGDPLTRDNMLERFAAAVCTQAAACVDEYGPFVPNQQVCEDSFGALVANFGVYLDADLYDFDAETAQACLDAIAAGCRLAIADPPPECAETFSGRLAQDDCCDGRGGCAAGFYCLGTSGGTTTGTCQTLGTAGADCAGELECAEGFYCNPANDDCAARVTQGNNCTAEGQCAEGLYCEPPGAARTCQPLEFNGQGCAEDWECASGACVDNLCTGNLFVGDACRTDDDQCAYFTECIATNPANPEGVCEPLGQVGDACDDDGITAPHCALYGLVCNAQSECEAGPGAGESCTLEGTCYPLNDLFCADVGGGDRSCLARLAEDDACDDADADAGCQLGLRCSADVCVPLAQAIDPTCN